MMIQKLTPRKGQSVIEYVTLITIVVFGLLLMQKYVARGLYGRWKGTGDALGHGRLYDPGITNGFFGFNTNSAKTIECAYDPIYTNRWYDHDCYEKFCDCQSMQSDTSTCIDCIANKCHLDECDQ